MIEARVNLAVLAGWRELFERSEVANIEINRISELEFASSSSNKHEISLADFVALLEKIGNNVKRPNLFWRAGETYDFSVLGDVGEAILSAKTLRGALKRFTDYFLLLQDATELSFETGERFSVISYRILDPNIWPRTCDAAFTLGLCLQLIRKVAGYSWHEVEVTLECERSDVKSDIASCVGTHCTYGGEANMIRFPVSFLDRPFNPDYEVAAKTLNALSKKVIYKKRNMPISERVKTEIYSQLGQGRVDQNTIARELGMSGRTLRRKLTTEDVSFQAILDECRMRVASLELKTRRNISLSETALRLGYSEHSSFSRAFTRWCGMTPQDFRRVERTEYCAIM
ncbi:AraC-like transcriptional regulator QhpR [Kordiimonas pumila]|uniref:AraC family transcriptional regulator ligand-binding domain-containing protein n=1 Tax=Kordiimonas pumila TaxID=2161677 RepID=A0ABV7D4Y7_9PROT|nr:AraC family transcriptional regulator [Kordiimonas pumila]